MPHSPSRARLVRVGAVLAGLVAGTTALSTTPAPAAPDASGWQACVTGSADRQSVFARASRVSGVPEEVLLGVSYMESRWDDHGDSPSTSGGYGPMHLTDVPSSTPPAGLDPLGKGEGGREPGVPAQATTTRMTAAQLRTADRAARLTGLSAHRLKTDAVANVCGGAALLAAYQHRAGGAQDLGDWSAAVARYSGASDQASALRFARQVFTTIRHGAARTTNDGQQVRLSSRPSATVDRAAVAQLGLSATDTTGVDCPATLGCEAVWAPYEKYGSSPGAYGNHDLADRPHDLKLDYIVIHDTEGYWDTAMDLVTTPTYLAWNYTVRSADGHIAQHLQANDVGWHAGNWYVNMHSIGIEHEGFAATGASWYTEAMYQDSAALVSHLATEYGIPLDRAHIIGHDQVPGILPGNVRGMHWDPGPYWDWEHYMALLGAPIRPDRRSRSDVVTVAPGFADNQQPVTGCDPNRKTTDPCPTQGTNFVYLHTEPSADSPLVTDVGLHPDGSSSTEYVSDIGARAAAGQKFLVAQRSGDWLGVWWLGDVAWLYSPEDAPTVVPSQGQVVVPAGSTPVPVYGRAYPERSAYPSQIPYQTVAPLQYTIKPGQAYVLADRDLQTDYYYAKTYNCAYVALDCTDVVGQDAYYEIWFGHRIAYVRAADVSIRNGVASLL